MMCNRARRLFGACWDDELTQAERDWLEAHFRSCAACRTEYDEFSRALEWTGALPRIEASPGLVDRVLARSRRVSPSPDLVGERGVRWVPVAAAAAVLLVAAVLVVPRLGRQAPGVGPAPRLSVGQWAAAPAPAARVTLPELRPALRGGSRVVTDENLFDHSKDLDLVIDQVTLRQGRVAPARSQPRGVEGNPAIISF